MWAGPRDHLIPNRPPARIAQRSNKVVYDTVKRVAARAGLDAHPHATRRRSW